MSYVFIVVGLLFEIENIWFKFLNFFVVKWVFYLNCNDDLFFFV